MQSALEANEGAIEALLQGREDEACEILRDSLKVCLDVLQSQTSPTSTTETGDVNVINYLAFEVKDNKDHNLFSIYENVFTLDSEVVLKYQAQPEIRDQVAVVLLYNLAFSYQLLGLKSATNQQQYLQRACNLYNMATRVLENNDFAVHGMLVQLAIYNNQSHIFSHSFLHRQVMRCLRKTHELMNELTEAIGCIPTEFIHFHVNLIVASDCSAIASPAA